MLNCFNEHFVSCGSMFDSVNNSAFVNTTVGDSEQCGLENPFSFTPFTVDVVREALTKLDPTKPAGPDNVEPFFLKIAAEFIAPPLTTLFNLSLSTNTIPKLWKSAYVLPLLKGGISLFEKK